MIEKLRKYIAGITTPAKLNIEKILIDERISNAWQSTGVLYIQDSDRKSFQTCKFTILSFTGTEEEKGDEFPTLTLKSKLREELEIQLTWDCYSIWDILSIAYPSVPINRGIKIIKEI